MILSNGGTTAFWDSATFGLIRDRAQFATFGEFGAKFAKAAKDAPFLGEPTVRKAEPGTAPTLVAEAGIDAYAIPHNETSTGVAVPVQRVAGADPDALMLHRRHLGRGRGRGGPRPDRRLLLRAAEGFGSDGGLWLALMSPAALARIEEIKACGRWIPAFLDLATAVEQSRLEQTYNTPALATIFLAAEQVDWMLAQRRPGLGGQAQRGERRRRSTAGPSGPRWRRRS